MARQHVEYKVPGTDKDSGEEDLTAIKPVADGEPAQAAVFKRPSENLRTRTEFIRDELEDLKYLSDSDKAMLLTSSGSITWAGLPAGTFTASANLVLRPFLAPAASSASRLIIGANTASQITLRTRQDGVAGQPRAYNGANTISFDFTPLTDNPILITVDGTPANNFHVRWDDNPVTGTTNAQMIAALQGNGTFVALGLEAVVEGSGVPVEMGFPTPPAHVGSNKVIISGPEQALRFMSGASEAEHHIITPAQMATFFADALNQLVEGDVIAVQYDALVMSPTYGGRRQSLNEAAEGYTALDAGDNLFLLRRFTSRIPGALPLCAVVNGTLIFINSRAYISGETGPLVSSGASYQGSPANPNSWADNTGVAGPVSFESALDTIITTLGAKTGTAGAAKVGTTAVVGGGPATFSTTAASVQTNIAAVVGEMNVKPSLGIQNTFTKNNTFTTTDANGTAITATGQGTGKGGNFNGENVISVSAAADGSLSQGGGNTGAGVGANGGIGGRGTGGASTNGTGGTGLYGLGGAGTIGGRGVHGEGVGAGPGIRGVSGPDIGARGGEFVSVAATSGPGVFSTGSGNAPGVEAHGGTTTNSYGVYCTSDATNGNGLLAFGRGEGHAILASAGTNPNTGSHTNGITPTQGPGTGVVGIGANGLGGGDGGQFFARMGVASTQLRTGVVGTGSYSQTAAVGGGFGGVLTGGRGAAGTGPSGIGARCLGGDTGIGPTTYGTRDYGAGIIALGGIATANGIVARGGSGSTIGIGTNHQDAGVIGVGSGAGEGVVGVSADSAGAVGVLGEGSTGFSTVGVRGVGKLAGPGVSGTGGATNGSIGGDFTSSATNGVGVLGTGTGTGVGVDGVAGATTGLAGRFLGKLGVGSLAPGGPAVTITGGKGGDNSAGPGGIALDVVGGESGDPGGGSGNVGGHAIQAVGGDGSDDGGRGIHSTGGGGGLGGGAGVFGEGGDSPGAPGVGVWGVGGVDGGGGGAIGVDASNGVASTTTVPTIALRALNGHLKVQGVSPTVTTSIGTNVLTGGLIPKAWGQLAYSAGVITVKGQNITSATFSGNNIIVTLVDNVTFACVVLTGEDPNYFWSVLNVQTNSPFTIRVRDHTNATPTISAAAGTLSIIVFGFQ